MSTDAVMSTRDSAEEREGAEMMSIDQKPSNVSMVSTTTTKPELTVKTNPPPAPPAAESRDDSGASDQPTRPEASGERQGPAATNATKKKTKKPPKKRYTKGRNQGRQPPPGPYSQQRGAMPYHTQMPPYGGPYGYGATGAPHDPYLGVSQYSIPPMPHHSSQQSYGAPAPGAPFASHPGQHLHSSYGSGPYGHPPPPPPPPSMYPYQGPGMRHPISSFPSSSEDTASIGSNKSKTKSGKAANSRKKRTIDGVDQRLNVTAPPQGLSSAFTMARVHSNASTSSTVTAGNNTSTDTPNLTEDSPQKSKNHLPPLSSRPDYQGSINMHEDANKKGYHRRDFSGASTTSSLSVGGLSLSSYETRGSKDDAPMMRHSPKRRRGDDGPTVASNEGLQKLSVKDDDKEHRENLFLTLSTSPINSDVEATPVSKNTTRKTPALPDLKTAPSMESISKDIDRNSDTPTPPVPSGAADSDMITDEHLLNRHLRGQTFTPLPHIGQYTETRDGNISPPGIGANPSFGSAIGAQLSWDITGDAPSLGEIGEWEEKDHRPGSVASHASGGAFAQWKEGEMVPSSHYPLNGTDGLRLSVLSPHSDEEMEENAGVSAPGGTTPIPFYENYERENGQLKPSASFSKDGTGTKPAAVTSASAAKFGDPEHIHQLFVTNGGRGSDTKRTPMNWTGAANYMRYPPAPLYTSESPMNGERGFFPNTGSLLGLSQAGSNDRIRNLRGRAPPGSQRMPMSHQLSAHLVSSYNHNLTSPMGTAPSAKGTSWSPHAAPSPNRVVQPDPNSNSKRKCLPMKPPLPTKFQGDIDKFKNAHMPEFASLVNFPCAMTQSKQANPTQLPEGMRCCVMCGKACPCPVGGKHNKKNRAKLDGSLAARNGNVQNDAKDPQQQMAVIPSQNKGLCTLCDVNVWIVSSNGLEIKWCKGCKNFRPWASFGDKGLATKCLRCRDRQREKYAIQKEEKERMRNMRKAAKQAHKLQHH